MQKQTQNSDILPQDLKPLKSFPKKQQVGYSLTYFIFFFPHAFPVLVEETDHIISLRMSLAIGSQDI